MPLLPDGFDLAVRRGQSLPAERQTEWLLGLLFAQRDWHFLAEGDPATPRPLLAELEQSVCLLAFSSGEKLSDLIYSHEGSTGLFSVSIPVEKAPEFCLQFRAAGVSGVLINPGEYAFAVSFDAMETFFRDWQARPANAQGFWIPNMTTEEEDFWQSHGL